MKKRTVLMNRPLCCCKYTKFFVQKQEMLKCRIGRIGVVKEDGNAGTDRG